MSESSQNSSFCAQCHRDRNVNGRDELNNLLGRDTYNFKAKDLKEAQTKFLKLQGQIALLKQQNQRKVQAIEQLKKQMIQKHRKTSVQLQIQQNKKSIEQLKSSLLSFGNQGLNSQCQTKDQKRTDSRSLGHGNISTELIINSLQKRLKQYKIELLKLIQKVQLHQKSTEWMYQFIQTFLKMVLEISKTGKYGESLQLKQLSIKKRTKIAWKYLKDILQKLLNN